MKTQTWLALASVATLATQVTLLYLPDPTGIRDPSTSTTVDTDTDPTQPTHEDTASAPQAAPIAPDNRADKAQVVGTSSAQKLTDMVADAVTETKTFARVLVNQAPRNTDKVVHASIFAAATATAVATLPRDWGWTIAAAQGAHALGGEHLQRHIPGRGYDRADIYANLVGVGIGTLAGYGLRRLLRAHR